MTRRLRHSSLATTLFLAVALGNTDAPTGIDLNALPHFPLKKIRSGLLNPGAHLAFDAITATATEGREVVLRGTTKSGRRWEAHMAHLDEVWRADLDGKGTLDYVFFQAGPYGNGRTAPSFSLEILLTDKLEPPVPFFTTVYRGENGEGIKHLVDLTHDGRAELLISTYDEKVSDKRAGVFCSGHWTSQAYRFQDGAAREILSTIGGLTFPLIHPWTEHDCAPAEAPFGKIEPAYLFEHGTSGEGELTTSIREVRNDESFTIDPVAGCETIVPSTIVYDRTHIREIGFPNPYSEYNAHLLAVLARNHTRVTLRGIDRWMGHGYCSANLILGSG